MENEISGFLISEYGFRKVRSRVPREDDPVDTNLFSCVLRIHEIHYLYFSEDMKHFSISIRYENPKGEAGTKGKRYWSYMALPKPIYSIEDARSLVEGICDFSTWKQSVSNMEQFFRHKGYFGSCLWSQEDNCFHGKVIDITDLVSYEGADAVELEKSFKEAVDDYIETLRAIKKERIDINIWDDYHDDGYVPEGEKQETCMYVESASVPIEDQLGYLGHIFDYIKANLDMGDVKYFMYFHIERKLYEPAVFIEQKISLSNRWQMQFENLTHERREMLIEELQKANLSLDGIPFNIYSES